MSVEDQLKSLTDKLKEMETKLQQQTSQMGDHSASTSASTSANAMPQAIRVSVPRERKFGKHGGMRDDRILEDWVADAE